jgi:hypothetical protein
MRGGPILLAVAMLSLSACEKNFDEKYQDNLEQLNEEARAIESGVSRHLAEGREADELIEAGKDAGAAPERNSEARQ